MVEKLKIYKKFLYIAQNSRKRETKYLNYSNQEDKKRIIAGVIFYFENKKEKMKLKRPYIFFGK